MSDSISYVVARTLRVVRDFGKPNNKGRFKFIIQQGRLRCNDVEVVDVVDSVSCTISPVATGVRVQFLGINSQITIDTILPHETWKWITS